MEDHVHMGVLFILSVAAAMILINATVRTLAVHNPDKAWAKGLTYILG